MGGKAEKGTPKYIANKIKAKGLQKLRWYCQMCQKQCRDENGFKCHTMSESHQRQLLLFADNAHELLDEFSKEFADGYCDLLQRQFGSKRVSANKVYQDYIADREHLHMNATQWETLTDFVKWAGREGRCTVDETEKGWFVTYIDRDPETVARQEAQAKKGKMDKDDAERMMEFIEKQVERGMQAGSSSSAPEYTELTRKDEDEKITVKLMAKPAAPKFLPPAAPLDKRKAFDSQSTSGSSISSTSSSAKKFKDGRKPSALDQIRFEEERRKQKYVKKPPPEPVRPSDAWLHEGIVVKVITNTLGPKYHKRKGTVLRVFSDYGAEVKMIDSGDKLKLDQEHLETVIPGLGRNVMAVLGTYRGQVGPLLQLEGEACRVQLGDRRVLLQFHELSKVGSADS